MKWHAVSSEHGVQREEDEKENKHRDYGLVNKKSGGGEEEYTYTMKVGWLYQMKFYVFKCEM